MFGLDVLLGLNEISELVKGSLQVKRELTLLVISQVVGYVHSLQRG